MKTMKISIILDSSEPREKKEKQRKIKIFWKTQREKTNTVFFKIVTQTFFRCVIEIGGVLK